MIINPDDNFCRVFELPLGYPSGYCFGEGKAVTFIMVDWFNPIHPDHINTDIVWDEYKEKIREWISKKRYVKPGYKYILITNFNESLIFTKGFS